MSHAENKKKIDEFLGEVGVIPIEELPLLFEWKLLCPECLYVGSLNTAGGGYECFHCSFRCRATVELTRQGRRWMALNEVI